MELLPKPEQANPVPASIVRAIATVMKGMTAVKKSQFNKHGGYNFASTDDIYASLSVKMAEAGLISFCLQDGDIEVKAVTKESLDKDGQKVTTNQQWLKATYTFILATEQDTWTDIGARRSLFLQVTGPTTFQAAQSYAEKSWLRSMFKIATGDMDLDGLPQTDEEGQEGTKRRGNKPKAEMVTPTPNGRSRDLPPLTKPLI